MVAQPHSSLKRPIIVGSVALAAMLFLYFVRPTAHWWTPKCPIKLLTTLSCPGCGIQRFLNALLHGNACEAVAYNYWLIYALPYTLALVVAWALPDGPLRVRARSITEHRYAVWFYVATFTLWFIIRNLLGI